MESVDKKCKPLKAAYDQCFNTWFSQQFLNGDTDDSKCAELFKPYQACVRVRFHNRSSK